MHKQAKTQSLTDYVAELRKLALTCDWNEAQLADNLRDKFVMGLYNEHLLQQLLTHDHKKSLEDLFQHALTFEAAEQESLKHAETPTDNTTVNALKQQLRKKDQLELQQIRIQGERYETLDKVINGTHAQGVEQITPIVLVVFIMPSVIAVGK